MAKKQNQLSSILKRLLFERKMKPIDLARALDIPQPTVHRIVNGTCTNPHKSTIEPLADHFGISPDQLKGKSPLPNNIFSTTGNNKNIIQIPLLNSAELHQLNSKDTNFQTFIAAMDDLPKNCFATTMDNSSMEPQFAKGTVLIFDPKQTPTDRSYVLATLKKNEIIVFRQLLIDAEHKFLKPLNPDLIEFPMRLLDQDDKIIGCLVEARQAYGRY